MRDIEQSCASQSRHGIAVAFPLVLLHAVLKAKPLFLTRQSACGAAIGGEHLDHAGGADLFDRVEAEQRRIGLGGIASADPGILPVF